MPTELSSQAGQAARRPRFFPTRLDWYVLTEVTGPFLGGVVFFSFIFLMFQALRLADFFIIHGVGLDVLGEMIGLLVLSFLPISLPVSFLIGVLISFGRLSSDSELVAMKANGISVSRLAVPVLALSAVVVVVSLALNMEWVPWGDRTFKSTLIKVSNTKVVSSIKEGTFTSGFFDLLIYADHLDPATNRLHRVFIYDEREPKNPLTVVAKEGEIVTVRTDRQLGSAVMLRLFDGNIHRNDLAADSYSKINFGEYRLYLKIDEGTGDATVKPRMVPYRDLMRTIRESEARGQPHREFLAEMWRRWAIALSPVIFVFLGIGFGTVRTRAVRAGAALIALATILVYWSIQALGTVAAQKGQLPPFLAMQLPNLVMGAVAWRAFRSASW
jgi:lipopolysaccharide export system permease protein